MIQSTWISFDIENLDFTFYCDIEVFNGKNRMVRTSHPAAIVAVRAAGGRVNLATHPAAIVAVQAAGGRVNLATHPAATSWVNMATQALLAKYPGSEASPSPNMTWTLALLTGLIVHSPPQQLSAELNVLAVNEDNQPGRQTMR